MKKLLCIAVCYLLLSPKSWSQPGDRDHDGIPDAVEQQLLEKFRPYFKFTLRDGQQASTDRQTRSGI